MTRILKRLLAVGCMAIGTLIGGTALNSAHAQNVTITGAGATFPYPLYANWAYSYEKATGAKLNYQSIGSGGGIAQIKAKTVDFGASDAPLKPEELSAAGLIQWPMIMGGVVPVVNLEGVKPNQLKLSGPLLADIYLGKVTKWNDPAIKSENADVQLPDRAITVVHRADGSGTTWIFTNYLTKVSPEWKQKVGNDKAVSWPTGVGGKGNEGVAAYVQRLKGSIGYVEYAYALENKMTSVNLKNAAGQYVAPTARSFQAAASNADWTGAKDFHMVLTDQPGKDSWPITGASFILMHKQQTDAEHARQVLKYFDWCYANGGQAAENLHYIAIPDEVVKLIKQNAWAQVTAAGKPVLQTK